MTEALTFDDYAYATLVQALIAFGEGAGPVLVSREAILAVTKDYRDAAAHDAERWDTYAPAVLSWAKAMGALAAHHALADSRTVVDAEDYGFARAALARHPTLNRDPCRWTALAASRRP
jgi:hypothetical protein